MRTKIETLPMVVWQEDEDNLGTRVPTFSVEFRGSEDEIRTLAVAALASATAASSEENNWRQLRETYARSVWEKERFSLAGAKSARTRRDMLAAYEAIDSHLLNANVEPVSPQGAPASRFRNYDGNDVIGKEMDSQGNPRF